jgi:predicted dehydrogenase/threonine dehydrogenase-like Zn-dependent dehydrogenase
LKQIIQDLKNGETILAEVPVPQIKPGYLLVKTSRSLVSLGTERMLVDFGKANYLQKARQQPDKVKMVLDKVKTDGLKPTMDAVFSKLNQPLPMGYCNAGKVVAVGKGVSGFKVGDRVASNGHHAEYVLIPENLAAKIPDNVSDEAAAFTVIGAIALQGIRLLDPTFGETVVVMGLGLIGLITAELLTANGCRVIGIDMDKEKLKIAQSKGITTLDVSSKTDPVKFVNQQTGHFGADGVIITASSRSNEIIAQSARMCRKRGRVILVGVVGLNISRADFYEKEISFQVSCSYGPGRYDENYEQKGNDYPIGFVRWTEQRNFTAVLEALSKGQLNVEPLITKSIALEDYLDIYGAMDKDNSIATLLEYELEDTPQTKIRVTTKTFEGKTGNIGIVGAGNFTRSTVLPNLKKLRASVKYIASSGGLSASILAKQFGISFATTDYDQLLTDEEVDLVLITTRHNLHAKMVVQALEAGKHVFVEKPLALNAGELSTIQAAYEKADRSLTVGFNRRFAPLAIRMKSLLGNDVGPVNIIATMNAGFIPGNSWVHDLDIGGGRIIGEACHFIDLCSFLTGSLVAEVCVNPMGPDAELHTDNMSILLRYENGSNAVVNYFANGSKAYSKERIEVYSSERTLVMDNWRKLKAFGFNSKGSRGKQDKGHFNQFKALLDQHKSGGSPIIPFGAILNATKASFAAIESMKTNGWVSIDD